MTPDYTNASSGLSEEDDGTPTEFDMEDYELSDEDLAAIEREVESCLKDIERADLDSEEERSTPLPDFDIAISRVKQASTCLNVRVQPGNDVERLAENYARIYTKLKPGIDSLTSQLRRVFQADVEEKAYRYSGKVNLKRLNSGRKTARVFDRRRLPAEKADVVVELLIDESGSMSGSKAEHAKQAAIALAEVMGNLKIPVYVIGFTADTSGYDAVHNHYITWKNTKADRFKLLNITARANNFDGYSIRYGGEILKKKNSKHKLMIVISDGSPACRAYWGTDGIADNKDAIRDVRKEASVLGVAIGNSDTEELHYMYGKDFIHIRNMDDLFAGIASKMASIIKSWE
jgi:nitric oxide reductase activation protein